MPKSASKNKRSYRLPIPQFCVEALKQLPSYQKHEYMFPARPNVKHRNVEAFQKPHAWDIGKRFRRIRDLAGIKDLRIHDLRHFATTMLFTEGVSDAIIRKMAGHRSEELERYKHLSPSFSQQTTELIAGKIVDGLEEKGTFLGTLPKIGKSRPDGRLGNYRPSNLTVGKMSGDSYRRDAIIYNKSSISSRLSPGSR